MDEKAIALLQAELAAIFGAAVLSPPLDLDAGAYEPGRRQFDGSTLLESLPEGDNVVLGVTEEDLFAGRLNFIFGIASPGRALISLRRLRPEFHGFGDERLFRLRTLKEAVHELGHALGLPHCQEQTCVMAFSNSILDTDIKDWRYCPRCKARLEAAGVRVKM